jgi:GntR family transcriptional repressor for pyruvate dehydrogenase complex
MPAPISAHSKRQRPGRPGRRPGKARLAMAGKGEPVGDLVAQVVDHLRKEIVSGSSAAGMSLPSEGSIAESLAVSRTVIREAMRSLRSQGLIVMSQGARPRVAEVDAGPTIQSLGLLLERSRATLLQVTEVRQPLETRIAALAAERATELQIKALEASIGDLERATSLGGRIEADIRFHDLLAEATGNPVFTVMLKAIGGLLDESRRRTIKAAGPGPAIIGHRRILAAVARRDPQAAEAAMRRHLDWAAHDIVRAAKKRRSYNC